MKEIYMIPDYDNLEKTMELAEKYNAYFEYNDFCMPSVYSNSEEVEKRIQLYKALERDRSHDMLHGAFLDVTIHSQDSEIRRLSEERVRQSLSIAEELGIRGVVFHANLIAGFYAEFYLDGWFEASIKFWKQMLIEYPTVEIYIENMFESRVDDLKRLAEAMKEEERFGICLDYSHFQVFGKDGKDWAEELAPYVKHSHINDNNLEDDSHWGVGNGATDWKVYTAKMQKNQIEASVLIEVKPLDSFEKSVVFMKKSGIYPFVTEE